MKKLILVFIFISIFTICSCNQQDPNKPQIEKIPIDSKLALELSSRIKTLCDATGLMIAKQPVYRCDKRRRWGYTYYTCHIYLKFPDEESVRYYIMFDKNKRLMEFSPNLREFSFYKNKDFFDQLPPGRERKQVLDTINRVNATLRLKYYGTWNKEMCFALLRTFL